MADESTETFVSTSGPHDEESKTSGKAAELLVSEKPVPCSEPPYECLTSEQVAPTSRAHTFALPFQQLNEQLMPQMDQVLELLSKMDTTVWESFKHEIAAKQQQARQQDTAEPGGKMSDDEIRQRELQRTRKDLCDRMSRKIKKIVEEVLEVRSYLLPQILELQLQKSTPCVGKEISAREAEEPLQTKATQTDCSGSPTAMVQTELYLLDKLEQKVSTMQVKEIIQSVLRLLGEDKSKDKIFIEALTKIDVVISKQSEEIEGKKSMISDLECENKEIKERLMEFEQAKEDLEEQVKYWEDKYDERLNEIDKLEHHISSLEKATDIISKMVTSNHGKSVDKEAQVSSTHNPMATHHLPPASSTSSLHSEGSTKSQNAASLKRKNNPRKPSYSKPDKFTGKKGST